MFLKKDKIALLVGLLVSLMFPLSAQEDRLALVIGNGNYSGTAKLKNPVNDANAVAAKLRSLAWDVTLVTDADIDKMESEINKFGDKVRTKKSPTVVFYYAGHGVEVEKENFLVPIGAETVEDPRRLRRSAYSFQDLARLLEENGAWSTIFILDACRDDPFPKKPDTRGMIVTKPVGITSLAAVPSTKGGTISLFSASSGETSADGTGRNGVFTEALLRRMDSSESLLNIFTQVRNDVIQSTGAKQNPRMGEVALADININFVGRQAASPPINQPVAPSPSVPRGVLVVTAKSPGKIYLQDEFLGEVGPGIIFEEPLEVGTHVIRFEPQRGEPEEQSITIRSEGSKVTRDFGLSSPAAPAASSGKAAVTSGASSMGDFPLGDTFLLVVEGPEPGMDVLINGELRGTTPLTLTLPRFNWELGIAHPDYEPFLQRVTPAASGQTVLVSPNIDHTRAYKLSQARNRRTEIRAQITRKRNSAGFAGFLNSMGWLSFWGGTLFSGYSFISGSSAMDDYLNSSSRDDIAAARAELEKYDMWTKTGVVVGAAGLASAILTGFFLPDVSKEERQLAEAESEMLLLGGAE